jgi:metacaspase-1
MRSLLALVLLLALAPVAAAQQSGRAIAVEPTAKESAKTAPAGGAESVAAKGRLLALFEAAGATGLKLEQTPPSPVKLGTKDIHFRVTSAKDGYLVLLSVSDEGKVVQLFPNKMAKTKAGALAAGHMLTLPDPSYGMRIDANAVTRGTVLALVTRDPLAVSGRFSTRAIEVVPQGEVDADLIPALEAAMAPGAGKDAVRSIATLRYEIIP